MLGSPDPSRAQQPVVRERQIPVDSALAVEEITPELRDELGVFPEIEGFRSARLFRLEDGRTVLEISFERDGTLNRERRQLGQEALAELRNEIRNRLAESRPSGGARVAAAPSQEGRGRLVLGETLLGLGFYGWALPAALKLDDPRPAVAAYLLTAGASFYLPYRLTRDAPVTDAHRHMALWGGTRGILYGLLLEGSLSRDGELGGRRGLAAGLATSVAGSVLGYGAVDMARLDEGTSVLWSSLADAGTLAGFGTAYAAGFYDDMTRAAVDPVSGVPTGGVEVRNANPRAADLTALAGSAAGLAAGAWLGGLRHYGTGDVSVLRSAILLGAEVGVPVAELTVGDSDRRGRRWAAGAVIGGVAGLAGGASFLGKKRFTPSQGLLMNAGQIAGGMVAVGATWLITPHGGNELLYAGAAALGSAAGLALTYRALSVRERIGARSDAAPGRRTVRRSTSGGQRASSHGTDGVQIELRPAALLGAWSPSGGGRSRPARPLAPFLTLRF